MKVFDPITIGPMTVKNRIVFEPAGSNAEIGTGPDQFVSDKVIDVYRERAATGAGIVIVEPGGIRRDGWPYSGLGIRHDRYLPGLTRLTKAIHEEGSRAVIELLHAGRHAIPFWTKCQPVAPSDQTPPWAGRKPRGLSTMECEEIFEAYAQAALRAKRAGFDGVEFHASHGYLPEQFISPYYNVGRIDRFADPTVFVSEMTRRTKEMVGKDLAVMIRIAGEEFLGEKGLTLKMIVEVIAPALEKAGIDAIDITTGLWTRSDAMLLPLYFPRGVIMYMPEAVKRVVGVPVIGVGRINDPRLVEKYLEEDRVDLIGLCRALMADPEFIYKMARGKHEEVKKCLACDACFGAGLPSVGRFCALNPTMGYWGKFPMIPAEEKRTVLVVGGGVAGMEAARVAALRGHDVTLCERSGQLGGLVKLSTAMPKIYTKELGNYVKYLENTLPKLNIHVMLNKEVTSQFVRELKPNNVVIASGSSPLIPSIPGAKEKNVLTKDEAIQNPEKVGKTVTVLGIARGAEIAVSLAKTGKTVTIIDDLPFEDIKRAPYIGINRWLHLVRMLRALVAIVDRVGGVHITQNGVEYLDDKGMRRFQEADTVILALGRIPNSEIKEEIASVVVGELDGEYIEIGDCVEPRSQMHAIHDGFLAAYGIGDTQGTKVSVHAYLMKEAAYRSPLPRVGPIGEVLNTEEKRIALSLPPLVPGQSSW